MRKFIFIIAVLVSLIILFFIIADIINSQVSYKYEIEEAFNLDCIDKKFASNYLIGKIKWLKIFLSYVVI
ncbi:MAG: hypothetical protein RR455_09590, partial [Bacteroidales bacterium]